MVVLGPSFHTTHLSYSEFAAVVSGLLLGAAWRWWPRPKQDSDVSVLRGLKWATVAVAIVFMACAIAPRRLTWDRFEVVLYKNSPSFVIGTRGVELLLYIPDKLGGLPQRVHRNSSDLVPTNSMHRLTDQLTGLEKK